MNNKKLGNEFEQEICKLMADHGYWVHFIVPDARGAQPFDVIAAKDKIVYAIECKTLTFSRRYFTDDRLEDNQKLAFNRWRACGNGDAIICVKQNNSIVSFYYDDLRNNGKIDIYELKNNECLVVDEFNIYGILKEILC